LKGPQTNQRSLLVALDEAGRQWTRGIIKLDEIKGEVVVDGMKVESNFLIFQLIALTNPWPKIASIFTTPFAEVTILCISVRLPMYTMHAVTSTIISAMRPTK
jgi:hypothetical protein